MENQLKNKKINLIGAKRGINGSDWRLSISSVLESYGAEILPSYIKPYIYTPREYPKTHEQLKSLKDTGYHKVISDVDNLNILDKPWLATHMRAVRSHELNNIKNCDLVVAHIDPDIFTIGAIDELSYACLFKKPILVVVTGGNCNIPFWLMGMLPHDYILDSFKLLNKTLKDVNDGKISINPDNYWDIKDYDHDYYEAIYKATNQKE
jgi:hypothetical protein